MCLDGCTHSSPSECSSLFPFIEHSSIRSFNAVISGGQSSTASSIFLPFPFPKPPLRPLQFTAFANADDIDSPFLFTIPFSSSLKIKTITVIASNISHTLTISSYVNHSSSADYSTLVENTAPTQIWTLNQSPNIDGDLLVSSELQTRLPKFSNVSLLSLSFAFARLTDGENSDGKIFAIAFSGIVMGISKDAGRGPLITNYEILPSLSDHPQSTDHIVRKMNY